ncbi:hypothetical protein TNCT_457621 [Trichonephila clavata]|uniref:Uncharacterized protein n=1 Tax=Trichonephila clavata TaxID=2740835 RepID=A0A8X6L825_TRICU|nr:hypothetical protein TNCT_457621 [Trichonephila clavata]
MFAAEVHNNFRTDIKTVPTTWNEGYQSTSKNLNREVTYKFLHRQERHVITTMNFHTSCCTEQMAGAMFCDDVTVAFLSIILIHDELAPNMKNKFQSESFATNDLHQSSPSFDIAGTDAARRKKTATKSFKR